VRGGLVDLLAEEQQALSGLSSPSGNLVVLQEGGDGLGVDGIGTEPEALLRVKDVPREVSAKS
jgi:hypothetical protein